ncbi:MAG: hypothetical protein WA419_14520 [Silvibacterium sp.]
MSCILPFSPAEVIIAIKVWLRIEKNDFLLATHNAPLIRGVVAYFHPTISSTKAFFCGSKISFSALKFLPFLKSSLLFQFQPLLARKPILWIAVYFAHD